MPIRRRAAQAEIARISLEQLVDDDEHDAEAEADVDVVPSQRAREDALCDRRHQAACGAASACDGSMSGRGRAPGKPYAS